MFDRIGQLIAANRTVTIAALVVLGLAFVPAVRLAGGLVVRVFSRLLLLVAVVALVDDATRTMAGSGGLVVTSVLDHWKAFSPASLETVQRTVATRLHPALWNSGLVLLLKLPTWLVLTALAVLLGQIGRRRRQTRVYANT